WGRRLGDRRGRPRPDWFVDPPRITESPQPLSGVDVDRARQPVRRYRESVELETSWSRSRADRGFVRSPRPANTLHHPLEHPHVLAVARPEKCAVGATPEPVHAEDLGRLVEALADVQPVRAVVGHVVAGE